MARGRTSITERLKKSQKRETRREMAHDWAHDWEQRYIGILNKLKLAIDTNNVDDVRIIFAELKNLQETKYDALHNVMDELIHPTRDLID